MSIICATIVAWVSRCLVTQLAHAHCSRSLQIFWQNFYRNVPWVVLYQTYHFCFNLLIWVVTMATRRQNLRKNIKKINSLEAVSGIKLKLFRIVTNISLYKTIDFFIAIAQALWLLWQLKVSIYLQWEKWKLRFIMLAHCRYFEKKFYRIFSWVVLHQAYHLSPNLSVWVVAMATERFNLQKILKSQLLGSYSGDKAETLQNSS